MTLARVVSFEGVSPGRIEAIRAEAAQEGPPDGVPATGLLVLHQADAQKAIVILFFDSEEDYARGDAVLDAMPAGDTPGTRSAVARCEVVLQRSM